MKFTALLLAAWAALPAAAQEFSTATMRPLRLGEAYEFALGRSEELAAQAEGPARLEAAERELGAAFRPAVDFNAALTKEAERDRYARGYLSASYSLFSGMRDYLALKAAAARTGAARLDLERARQKLYLSAAQAYLNLQAAQRELFIRDEQLLVTARRVEELEARAAIGRSRRSEVVSARSQLAQERASREGAAAAERLAQRALRFLTGVEEDLAPAALPLRLRAGLQAYERLALERPDLRARALDAGAYDHLAEIQRRSAWPSASLAAEYYVLRDPMPEPENRWNAGAYLKVPLYSGGELAARREAALSDRRRAGLALDLARRGALSEVRSAWDEHSFASRQADSLAEALTLAGENARLQQEDYRLGLVNNLDVLNALNTLEQTALALSQARARVDLALIKLETAAGAELPK